MKIGLLADAHGNPVGLGLCLAALAAAGAERLVFLGDALGYFPDGPQVLAMLERAGALCLMGNHEAMLLGRLPLDPEADRQYGLARTGAALSPAELSRLAAWPESVELELGGRRLICMHGRPGEPLTGYLYPDADLAGLGGLAADALFTAHTHRPFTARAGGVLVVNVGSVGLPRQGGALASCTLYDTESGRAELLEVPLPVGELLNGYRHRLHQRVREVLLR